MLGRSSPKHPIVWLSLVGAARFACLCRLVKLSIGCESYRVNEQKCGAVTSSNERVKVFVAINKRRQAGNVKNARF